jgi:hypothetical protein
MIVDEQQRRETITACVCFAFWLGILATMVVAALLG